MWLNNGMWFTSDAAGICTMMLIPRDLLALDSSPLAAARLKMWILEIAAALLTADDVIPYTSTQAFEHTSYLQVFIERDIKSRLSAFLRRTPLDSFPA